MNNAMNNDRLEDALRREFASVFVPYDAARAEAAIDAIHACSPAGDRRRWAAPLAAAAAVLVVGSGATALGLHSSGEPAGGGAVNVPPTPTSSVPPSVAPIVPPTPTLAPTSTPTSAPAQPLPTSTGMPSVGPSTAHLPPASTAPMPTATPTPALPSSIPRSTVSAAPRSLAPSATPSG